MEQMEKLEKDIEAIKGSIIKWKAIAWTGAEDRGPQGCSLCQIYFSDGCVGCPIYIVTGVCRCNGTKYVEWCNHLEIEHEDQCLTYKVYCPECRDLAVDMVRFLEKLLVTYQEKHKALVIEKLKKDLKLVKGSVEKWHNIRFNHYIDKGIDNCPLCQEYWTDKPITNHLDSCKGCPIKEETGEKYCRKTPYKEWQNHIYSAHKHNRDFETLWGVNGCKKCILNASSMLNFLLKLEEKLRAKLRELERKDNYKSIEDRIIDYYRKGGEKGDKILFTVTEKGEPTNFIYEASHFPNPFKHCGIVPPSEDSALKFTVNNCSCPKKEEGEDKMEITIQYGKEKGRPFSKVSLIKTKSKSIHDPNQQDLFTTSREITGTTDESEMGIFTLFHYPVDVRFYYGSEKRSFEIPSYKDDHYVEQLLKVIEDIRHWVQTIDYTTTIQFAINEIGEPNKP